MSQSNVKFFQESDYRKIIKGVVNERKLLDTSLTFQSVAEHLRMPKSYLSKILSGSGHLNTDQLFLLCKYLQFSQAETDYLNLLLDHDRTGLKQLKDQLHFELKTLREGQLETKNHLVTKSVDPDTDDLGVYYLDPLNQIVHMALTIARYRKDLALMALDLCVPLARVEICLVKLETMGIIERQKDELRVVRTHLHLPPQSHYFRPWKTSVRQLANQRADMVSDGHSYTFSGVFTGTTAMRTRLKELFLNFLREAEALSDKVESEDVFQMNFDLIDWTKQ